MGDQGNKSSRKQRRFHLEDNLRVLKEVESGLPTLMNIFLGHLPFCTRRGSHYRAVIAGQGALNDPDSALPCAHDEC
jgi:hypothetical protein